MSFKVDQGSSVLGDWADILTEDGQKVAHIETKPGAQPVVSVFSDGAEATHVVEIKSAGDPNIPAFLAGKKAKAE